MAHWNIFGNKPKKTKFASIEKLRTGWLYRTPVIIRSRIFCISFCYQKTYPSNYWEQCCL